MSRRVAALAVLNVLLAATLALVGAERADAQGPGEKFSCRKQSVEGVPFCCALCCEETGQGCSSTQLCREPE